MAATAAASLELDATHGQVKVVVHLCERRLATLRDGGGNPTLRRLQPCVMEAATPSELVVVSVSASVAVASSILT